MIDLGYILRRAWEIAWRHKILWLFGFCAGLGTVGARLGMGGGRWDQPAAWLPPEAQRALVEFARSPYAWIAVVVLALLALAAGLGLALLSALGHAALVDGARAAEDRERVSLRDGWQAGKRILWPVFFIRLLLGSPVAAVTLAGALPVLVVAFLISGQVRPEVVAPGVLALELFLFGCLGPAVCLAVLLSIPLGVLQRLAVRACVLEGLGVRRSIQRAWTMLREHPGPLALVWLMLLGIGIGVLLATALPLLLLALPLLGAAMVVALVSPLAFFVLTLAGGLAVWLVGAAVNGVAETFFSTAWTLTYRDLTGAGLTGEEVLLRA
jgi:hypothetical protein